MVIQITKEQINQPLSEDRAASVATYLKNGDLSSYNLKADGLLIQNQLLQMMTRKETTKSWVEIIFQKIITFK